MPFICSKLYWFILQASLAASFMASDVSSSDLDKYAHMYIFGQNTGVKCASNTLFVCFQM